MDIKRCPFCAEDVKAEAVVCRYCGRALAARRLSHRERRWIFANNMVGSIIFFSIFFAIFLAALAEFTGIAGGFAPLAAPFSPIRNEIAKGYGAVGVVIGFAVGILHGTMTARHKLARASGEEIYY